MRVIFNERLGRNTVGFFTVQNLVQFLTQKILVIFAKSTPI